MDTSAGGDVTVSSERDRSGQVLAFYLSNVRTRGVRFERVRQLEPHASPSLRPVLAISDALQ